jgi:hypothetical protein
MGLPTAKRASDIRAGRVEAFLLIRLAIQNHGRFGRSHATALPREEPILNLGEFDGRGAFFVVVNAADHCGISHFWVFLGIDPLGCSERYPSFISGTLLACL